jgi:glycerol-3-phosphate dehydrogenase (NAD+)
LIIRGICRGANIAQEVAADRFSETTIGYRNRSEGLLWQFVHLAYTLVLKKYFLSDGTFASYRALFQTKQFRVQLIDDVAGVSLCGALKNIVAVGAGFNDGLKWGDNAKGQLDLFSGPALPFAYFESRLPYPCTAAIMRIGLLEMKHFCQEFFEGVKEVTFLQESAGVADLITTCLGGRNRTYLCLHVILLSASSFDPTFVVRFVLPGRCAEAFVTAGKTFAELEESMLGGQKLQGIYTAQEIHNFLKAKGRTDGYPLFETVRTFPLLQSSDSLHGVAAPCIDPALSLFMLRSLISLFRSTKSLGKASILIS